MYMIISEHIHVYGIGAIIIYSLLVSLLGASQNKSESLANSVIYIRGHFLFVYFHPVYITC